MVPKPYPEGRHGRVCLGGGYIVSYAVQYLEWQTEWQTEWPRLFQNELNCTRQAEKENERKKRGEILLFRAGLHSLKFPSSNLISPALHQPRPQGLLSPCTISENEKTLGMRLVLNYLNAWKRLSNVYVRNAWKFHKLMLYVDITGATTRTGTLGRRLSNYVFRKQRLL